MKNLKLSMKLIVSFGLMIVMSVAVGVCGIVGMNSINTSCNNMYEHNFVPSVAIGNIAADIMDMRLASNQLVIYEEKSDIDRVAKVYDEAKLTLDKHMQEYEVTINNPTETALLADLKKAINEWQPETDKVREWGANNQAEQGREHLLVVGPLALKVEEITDKILEYNVADGAKASEDTDTQYFTLTVLAVAVLIAAVFVAVFFTIYMTGLIAKPLGVLSGFMKKAGSTGNITMSREDKEAIERFSKTKDEIGQTIGNTASFISHVTHIAEELLGMSKGDLTVEIEKLSEEDVLGASLVEMEEMFGEMFGEINSAASQVSTGSKQIADGAQSLAQGSTQQAASIEELSSSITEIAEKTKANAETAERTAHLSATIRDNAEKGSRQMDEMMAAVKDINEASQSISKVIKVIDDIAFQTNILALNAAVEAARAGQHGKGFAVVAEEVRNLASKSAEAAKETGNLIANSTEKAELGSRIAGETAASLAEIVSGINESSQLIAEIANSSEQQSAGITQINIGIDQVAQVVQQNSATAEESAAASEEMSGQSDMLQQLISQFKLKDDSRAISRPAPRATLSAGSGRRLDMPEKNSGDFGKY